MKTKEERQMAVINEFIENGPWTYHEFFVKCVHYRLTEDMIMELVSPFSDSILVHCKDGIVRER